MKRAVVAAGACLLVSSACGAGGAAGPDALPDADLCLANLRPEAPTVQVNVAGRDDVWASEIALTASGLVDPDGDPLASAEFEIWAVDGMGQFDQRAWTATVSAARLADPTPIGIADGSFEGGAFDFEPWQRYAARVRYLDGDALGCSLASEYSAPVGFRTDDGSRTFFAATEVRQIHLTLSQPTIDALNAQAYPPGCVPFERDYYVGDVEIDGVSVSGVGVKTKGGCGSARDLNGKPGFKIDLNWDDPSVEGCPDKRRVGGQTTLTLNNQVQDASYQHERLGYALYAAMGVPVPRVNPAQVWVNGTYYGLYLNVESPTRRFLEHNFDHPGGMLYEGTYWCDLLDGNVGTCLTAEFSEDVCDGPPDAGDDPIGYEPLQAMIDQIDGLAEGGNFYPGIEAVLELDVWLGAWAAEALISHWDGYNFAIVNNYRVYRDPGTSRWSLIPTGIDQTFSGDSDPWSVNGRIAQLCLASEACEARFAATLAAAAEAFTSLDLLARSAEIRAQIRPMLQADPGRGTDAGGFDGAHEATRDYIRNRVQRIGEHLAAHGF